jgi:tetratricopeptide (TPR) repeat protein
MRAWQRAVTLGARSAWLRKNLGASTRQEAARLAAAGDWPALARMANDRPAPLDDPQVADLISLARFHLGYAHAQKDDWEAALREWQQAAALSQNRYLAHNLALAYERLDQLPEAANAWRDLLKRRPRSAEHPDALTNTQVSAIWAHAADCYVQAWEDQEAITCFQKAIQYDPHNLSARFRLVDVYQDVEVMNVDAAMRELAAVLDLVPDNIEALTRLATLQSRDWRYNAAPLWKRIIALDPNNTEAREALVSSYLARVFPHMQERPVAGGAVTTYRGAPLNNPVLYTQRLNVLREALELLPDHPRLMTALGALHLQSGHLKLAREALLRAYDTHPNNPTTASHVLQNLALMDAADLIDALIPRIHAIPTLMAAFWIDQAMYLLDHPAWAARFLDEAVRHADYSTYDSQASVLVSIGMALDKGDHRADALKAAYLRRIRQDAPDSGAVEYMDGFLEFQRTGNVKRARSKLQAAERLARAANDASLLREIQEAQRQLASPPPDAFLDMLRDMDDDMLGDLLDRMEGLI